MGLTSWGMPSHAVRHTRPLAWHASGSPIHAPCRPARLAGMAQSGPGPGSMSGGTGKSDGSCGGRPPCDEKWLS